MGERFYRGTIRKHLPITAKTGTPGIEFEVDIKTVKNPGQEWRESVPMTRRVSIWFPTGGDHSYSLKKLRHAGWRGGGLDAMDLTGNTAELSGTDEEYQGRMVEKFELCFPPRETQVSESAALTIDAILQSAPVDLDPEPVAKKEPEIGKPTPQSVDAITFDQINEIADGDAIPF